MKSYVYTAVPRKALRSLGQPASQPAPACGKAKEEIGDRMSRRASTESRSREVKVVLLGDTGESSLPRRTGPAFFRYSPSLPPCLFLFFLSFPLPALRLFRSYYISTLSSLMHHNEGALARNSALRFPPREIRNSGVVILKLVWNIR